MIPREFLLGKNTRPLYTCMWEPALNTAVGNLPEGVELSPGHVSEEAVLELCRRILASAPEIAGDLPISVQAGGGYPWAEAACGCRVVYRDGQLWALPPDDNTLEDFLKLQPRQDWAERLFSLHSAVTKLAGVSLAALPVLHGPLDILSAFLGGEELAYAFYDDRDLVAAAIEKAADILTGLFLELSKATQEAGEGPYVSRMHIVASEPAATLQNDASYLVTPQDYRELVLPAEQKMRSKLPFVTYHMHNSSLHHLETIADLRPDVIQLSVDASTVPLEEQARRYESAQKRAPLLLSCWSYQELEFFHDVLSHQNLGLSYIPAPDGCAILPLGGFAGQAEWNACYRRMAAPEQQEERV